MNDFKYIIYFAGTSRELDYAPDGWDESSIKNERSDTYFGMFRSYTSSPVKFVKDGAYEVRNSFYLHGVEADVKLEVQRLNKLTLVYELIFYGELDFSTFKDFDTYCEVGIIEGGMSKYIKLNEETEYVFNIKTLTNAKLVYIDTEYINYHIYYINPQHLLFALLDKMTDGKFTSYEYNQAAGAFWYNICYAPPPAIRLAITTGKAIRYGMIEDDPGTIKLTFKDFFNAINSIYCIGCGIEVRDNIETFVWYDRAYFYNSANLIQNIGDISSVNISVAKDFIYSTIKVGYTAQEYTVMSNYNEPNTEISFKAPITRLTKEYDVINTYRGDFNGVDEVLSDRSSESSDDEIFFIVTTFNDSTRWYMPELGYIRRWIAPNVAINSNGYNIRISPARCLLNHLPFLMSGYDKLTAEIIAFTASANPGQDIPGSLRTSIDQSAYIDESADIAITTNQMFLPYIFEIEDYALTGLINAFITNRPGVIQFMYNGIQYEGFIIDSTIKLIGKGTVNFKLLATTNNDMTNLIR